MNNKVPNGDCNFMKILNFVKTLWLIFMKHSGPAIPSLMNKTPNGGRTLWETPIELEAQEASWIG